MTRSVTSQDQKFEHAREFLARVIAWSQEGDPPSFINLHWTFVPKNGARKDKKGKEVYPWSGRACRTVDEAVKALDFALQPGSSTRDIYVCLSSQAVAQTKTGKNNRVYYTPIRNQQGVVALKSIFLDIDFKGGDHGYDTPEQAVEALSKFIGDSTLPKPTVIVRSGGGLHVYWTTMRALTRDEWQPLAYALAEATKRLGLKCDTQCTIDSARVLRVPETFNYKTAPPRPVTLAGKREGGDYTVERLWQALEPYKVAVPAGPKAPMAFEQAPGEVPPALRTEIVADELGANIGQEYDLVHLDDLATECGFIRDAIASGGLTYSNPMWNLTTLIATFSDDARNDAHRMGNKHPHYTKESTDDFFDRKQREKTEKGLGFPSCASISGSGCTACQTCPHFANGRSPLAALPLRVTVRPEPPSYADPYSEFVGPQFPTEILPALLASFVEAEHQSMGADASALAMAALTAVGAALTSESRVQVGEGWFERPIIFAALVGDPSTMKSPVIDKVLKTIRKIDHDRDAIWRTQKSHWNQQKAAGNANLGPPPAKPERLLIQDATPEKTAEILSRGSAGSLMHLDELAGWMGSFDRYGAASWSRAFYLTAYNGGPYLKDRVGQGAKDDNAEIRVENLALCIFGGIQPDRLAGLRDLTSDGLLQRFLVVLMAPAKRGNQKYAVAAEEAQYARLIQSVNSAPPKNYVFAPDAEAVLTRVLDRLYELEQVQGFAPALIGAIGKFKGYYARLALVLQVATEHSATVQGNSAPSAAVISRQTAEATEKLLFEFLLPHTFGLYDVVVNGGQDRDTIRAIGDFILASDKERLRPSDFTAGVRRLRSQPANKIVEWASRYCALGWLRPEDDKNPAPKAWLVDPGLRTHFEARRRHAQAARAAAHEILKAGGTQR